ncbi:MAG: hypothetical protein JXC32_12300 [Anaerolineae bacterium]|nr:hypothetical protein [Anaerolineae bacterium]
MYKDEIWYRKLELAINDRQDDFTDKQWRKYQVDHLLKVANRVRETSEDCEVCQSYQHTLTRLEEEFAELPGSKAQRQYQSQQLREMGQHFVKAHNLAPPGYFLRHWLRTGLIGGVLVGLVAMVVFGNLLLLPGGVAVVGGAAALYGMTLDQKAEREHRLI